jgi:hypothetical protein
MKQLVAVARGIGVSVRNDFGVYVPLRGQFVF